MSLTEANKYYLSICREIEEAEESQMFGNPCFKINKKAFVCFFENEMVFKLTGDYHSEAISLDGTQLFDPSKKGRPMKEWVQVPYHYKELWKGFAKSALEYCRP